LLLTVLILAFAALRRPDALRTSLLALSAAPLISPYSWSGYSLFLLPAFLGQATWSWRTILAAGLFAIPLLLVMEAFAAPGLIYAATGWLYGWAAVLMAGEAISATSAAAPAQQSEPLAHGSQG
jgi:hypothetical protein